MKTDALESTAQKMVADGKGLIAIDESIGTCNKRFAKWDIPQTEETRRQYRELLVATPVWASQLVARYSSMKRFGKGRVMALPLLKLL